MAQFCREISVPTATFRAVFKDSTLRKMKREGKSVQFAAAVLSGFLRTKKEKQMLQTKFASASNRFLSYYEELSLVQMCRLMSLAGQGVTKNELLQMASTLVHLNTDEREIVEPVEGMMKCHKDLVTLISADSIDPARAKQANVDTRDAMFAKLVDAYVELLHSMGKVPWASYKDIQKYALYNMDELGTDTTKDRSKVLADAKTIARAFQVNPEGDGKMNMHCTACITTRADGMYFDSENLMEGVCAPLLIHTDKSKTKEKEEAERARQRNGESPIEQRLSPCFLAGLDESTDIKVQSTKSGSMTQEIFFIYAELFVDSLNKDHKPVILFLDGHASQWNAQALRLLMENNVWPFFLASHTSIWSQPNDCGVNKRFHWAVEESVRAFRRTAGTPTLSYFNEVYCKACWRIFKRAERSDLQHLLGYNNATNAYKRTGLFPLNPFSESWTTAVETCGVLGGMDPKHIQYEPVI
jgi:hypothetical protein